VNLPVNNATYPPHHSELSLLLSSGDTFWESGVLSISSISWRRGAVVSVVRCMNEVTVRRARLVGPTGMGGRLWTDIPSRYVTSQLAKLSLASLRGR